MPSACVAGRTAPACWQDVVPSCQATLSCCTTVVNFKFQAKACGATVTQATHGHSHVTATLDPALITSVLHVYARASHSHDSITRSTKPQARESHQHAASHGPNRTAPTYMCTMYGPQQPAQQWQLCTAMHCICSRCARRCARTSATYPPGTGCRGCPAGVAAAGTQARAPRATAPTATPRTCPAPCS